MPSPTTAKIVAEAYGYQVDRDGTSIVLFRYEAKADPPAFKVATIARDGEIIPHANREFPYSRADHECAMAIRSTMPL